MDALTQGLAVRRTPARSRRCAVEPDGSGAVEEIPTRQVSSHQPDLDPPSRTPPLVDPEKIKAGQIRHPCNLPIEDRIVLEGAVDKLAFDKRSLYEFFYKDSNQHW